MSRYTGLFLSILLFYVPPSEARVKSLSLDIDPTAFQAHQSLRFNPKAFKARWLKKEIACHFEEGKKGCRNLAALLRMYVEAVPNQRKLRSFVYEIKDKLNYDERKYKEVALFLYLYFDDNSLKHVLNEYDLEYIRERQAKKNWNVSEIKASLLSEDETLVEHALSILLRHPNSVLMADEVFEQVVQVSSNDSFSKNTQYSAINYLNDMGFYISYRDDEQGKFEFEKITVHSGMACLTDYLAANPMSKVWKYYANQLTTRGMGDHSENDTEMVELFQQISFNSGNENKQKVRFIMQTKTYQESQSSLKFIIGDKLMFSQERLGLPILKQAYQQGNNAMKSTIVAKYAEHFPVKKDYWIELKKNSSAAEIKMIDISKNQWDINSKKQQ